MLFMVVLFFVLMFVLVAFLNLNEFVVLWLFPVNKSNTNMVFDLAMDLCE